MLRTSDSSILATGTLLPRQLSTRFAEEINVCDCGTSVVGAGNATVDSAAFLKAWQLAAAAKAAGLATAIHIPPGVFTLASPPPLLTAGIVIRGAGPHSTYIKLNSSFVGDFISFSEAWFGTPGTWDSTLGTFDPAIDISGPQISDFTLIGDRSASGQQNGIMFYDRVDRAVIDNIDAGWLNGSLFSCGILKNKTESYMRESTLSRIWTTKCGQSGVPTIAIGTLGSGDSTNTNKFVGLDIFFSQGPGVSITNGNTVKTTSYLDFFGLRIEDSAADDCLVVGDGTLTGGVSHTRIYGGRFIAPPSGKAAIKFKAPDATSGLRHSQIHINGMIGPGVGKGIDIQAGQKLGFDMASINTTDTNITVGASSNGIGSYLSFEGRGIETNWTWAIDSTSASFIRVPIARWGDPTVTGLYSVA